MKYYKRLKIYKNSTGNNTYNPVTKEAISYKWWTYSRLSPCGEYIIFNNTTYSNTTSKHQRDTMRLITDNYKNEPKTIVLRRTMESLGNLSIAFRSEVEGYLYDISQLKEQIAAPRSRKKTNEEREKRIENIEQTISILLSYMDKFGISYDRVDFLKYTPVRAAIKEVKNEMYNG